MHHEDGSPLINPLALDTSMVVGPASYKLGRKTTLANLCMPSPSSLPLQAAYMHAPWLVAVWGGQ